MSTHEERVRRAEAVRERLRRPPCWGPNEHGEMMVDMSVEAYEADLDRLLRAFTADEEPVAPARRRKREWLHVRRADGMDLCEYDDEDWPCAAERERLRPWSDPAKPGRVDEDGVEWWACDPYPTWYRWDDGKLKTKARPKWKSD